VSPAGHQPVNRSPCCARGWLWSVAVQASAPNGNMLSALQAVSRAARPWRPQLNVPSPAPPRHMLGEAALQTGLLSPHPKRRVSPATPAGLTKGVLAVTPGSFSPALKRASASGPISLGSVGLLLKGSPSTTSMGGRRSATARTYTPPNPHQYRKGCSISIGTTAAGWGAAPALHKAVTVLAAPVLAADLLSDSFFGMFVAQCLCEAQGELIDAAATVQSLSVWWASSSISLADSLQQHACQAQLLAGHSLQQTWLFPCPP
jgi:hypothetical protein